MSDVSKEQEALSVIEAALHLPLHVHHSLCATGVREGCDCYARQYVAVRDALVLLRKALVPDV